MIFIAACVEAGIGADLNKRGMFQFCQKAKITDNICNVNVLTKHFKDTNFEEVDQEGNDDNALVRFEFIEMLIRIAKYKFIDYGQMQSLEDATSRLIEKYVLPMKAKLVSYEKWRHELLYTNEVNELL